MKTIINILVFIFVLAHVIILFSGFLELETIMFSIFNILMFTIISVINNEKQ